MTITVPARPEPRSLLGPRVAIAYVVSRWGEPTQTFVRREANATAAAGAAVHVLSIKRPRHTTLSLPVTHLGPLTVVVGLLCALHRRRRLVWGVIRTVVRSAARRNLGPQLAACCVGLAWAARSEADVSLIHAHFGWVSATAAWAAARLTGRPYSVVLHSFEIHRPRYRDALAATTLREATAVFTISERDAEIVRQLWSVRPRVLRMGVNDEWLTAGLHAGPRDPWLLVSVGSLVPKKGHATLLDALRLADERWRLVIAGDGRDRRPLLQQCRRLGLTDRVTLAGHLDEHDLRALLQRASVFVLASVVDASGDRDGIPVALMEAMATRLPVVTTDASAARELVDDAGIIVPAGDPEALSHALDRLRAPTLRNALGSRGAQRVRDLFDATQGGQVVAQLAQSHANQW